MWLNSRWLIAILILVALLPLACQRKPAKAAKVPPAKIEKIQGSEISRVTLTERAEQRLGIETGAARAPQPAEAGKAVQVVLSYDAVIHDIQGKTWVYTNPGPQTFVRHPVGLRSVRGDLAFLSEGPAPGTKVVTVGAQMLYATELKFGAPK